MCWNDCRCQSLIEKLAWAYEAGLAPPPKFAAAFAEYSANRRARTLRTLATAKLEKSSTPACRCCSPPAGREPTETEAVEDAPLEPRGLVLLEVARCRGVSPGVFSLSEALWTNCEALERLLPSGESHTPPAEIGGHDRAEPLEPPPRRLVAV
ncbi:MAG: hypothetical protein U0939_17295 [Pirellulales bacterium]